MRIKVDFSDFFDDQRKLSVVNVNTQETKTVRDVLYKILLMFKLTPAAQKRRSSIDDISKGKLEFGLFEEGFYIPPEETSTVLQDIGILKFKSLVSTSEDDGDGKKKKRKRQKVEEDQVIEEYEIIPRKGRSKKNKLDLENNVKDRKRHQRRNSIDSEEEEEVEKEEQDTRERKIHRKRNDAEENEGEENEKKGKKKMSLSTGKMERTMGRQGRDSVETDDEEQYTRDKKMSRRRRQDSTETEEEIEEGEDDKRKGGRKREFLIYNKSEEGKVHRQKKGHQKRHHLQTEVEEDEEVIENELDNRGKTQRGKNSRSSAHVTHTVSDDEEKIKKYKKKERILLKVENQEEEEIKNKKKNKREQESKVADNLIQESRNKPTKICEHKGLRTTRQIYEQHEAEPSSTVEQQGKKFQEKEVSTSCVINVESNEESEGSSSCSSTKRDNSGKNLEADSALGSSVTGEACNPRAKRKRKHNKGKKSKRHNINEEVSGTSQGHCSTSHLQDHPFRHSKVSTSSQKSHVLFNTDDDDEEVSSVSNLINQGNDIEIVGTASGLNRRHLGEKGAFLVNRACSDEENRRLLLDTLHGGHFTSSTPKCNRIPPLIEIEGDDASALFPTSSEMPVSTTNSVTRTSSQNRLLNQDCFAALRQLVEKKTVTVVSISSSTCTVHTPPVKLPEVVPATKRGPPHPVFTDNTMSEETRNIFYDLLRLKNQLVPLVLRTPREAILNSVSNLEDSDCDSSDVQNDVDVCEVESCVSGTKCKSAQALSLVAEKRFQQNEAKGSCEVLSIPSTSGYMENVEVIEDRPGAAPKNSRRSIPRPFQSVGSLLSNLRNPETSQKISELQEETDNDIDIEMVQSAEVDSKVTSTQGDARPPEETQDEDFYEKGETSESSLGEPSSIPSTSFPVSLDKEETQQLMEDMITETLKQDMAKDVQPSFCEQDTRFLSQPIMKTLPKAGEYIAMKVLSLDEKLCPTYSPYIAAKVLKVVGLMVTLKIIDEKKSKEGQRVTDQDGVEQVDLTFDDEVDLTGNEQEEILELDWRDIYQPRHLFP